MSDLVDEMARAAFKADTVDEGALPFGLKWETVPEAQREFYRDGIRAAVKRVLELANGKTDAEIVAGLRDAIRLKRPAPGII